MRLKSICIYPWKDSISAYANPPRFIEYRDIGGAAGLFLGPILITWIKLGHHHDQRPEF